MAVGLVMMTLGACAVAWLAIVPEAAAQLIWAEAPLPDERLYQFVVDDKKLSPCNSLVWGSPICLSGHTLVNVSWKSQEQQPEPANIIFNNPNTTYSPNNPTAANAWCANISVVASSGLTLVGCNKTVDQVRLCIPYSLCGCSCALWLGVFPRFLTAMHCWCGTHAEWLLRMPARASTHNSQTGRSEVLDQHYFDKAADRHRGLLFQPRVEQPEHGRS